MLPFFCLCQNIIPTFLSIAICELVHSHFKKVLLIFIEITHNFDLFRFNIVYEQFDMDKSRKFLVLKTGYRKQS